MHSLVNTAAGGSDVIQLREVPTPEPGPRQVRVRVRAAGLNRADILQRRGQYPAPPGWPADIPGLEYSGEVEQLGAGATRWQIGDRVMGLVGGGAHAENVVVHEGEGIPMPAGMSFVEAAAVPEAFLTAYDALVTRGRLQRGERVLVHAVGSGVGTAATQLAKWIGATTLGTSRSADKLQRAREYGLDQGIDTRAGSFRPALTQPVDVIIDVLGGPAFAENLDALAPLGRLVMLGHLQGAKADLSLEPILRKRLTVVGSVMRTRSLEERIPLVAEFAARVVPLFEGDGRTDGQTDGTSNRPLSASDRLTIRPSARPTLRPVVGATFPFTAIAEAHAAMEEDRSFGKIVLAWRTDGQTD